MELLKLLSTGEIIAQVISFLILLAIMRIFVWRRFLKFLDDRRALIASEFQKIEAGKEDASKMKAEYDSKIGTIEEIGKAKIQEAIIEGKRIAEEIKKDADREAQRMLEEGRDMLKDEVTQAREELKNNIVDLVIDATEKVSEERLTEGSDRKMIEDFIQKIGKR